MSGNDFQAIGTEEGNDIVATESGSGLVADVVYPNWSLVLRAVIKRLRSDDDLLAITSGNIRTELPQDAPLPYVRVRLSRGREYDTKDSNGIDHSIVCDVWSDVDDFQVADIMQMIYVDLHDRVLTGLVAQSLKLMLDNMDTFIEGDGSHHGVVSFSHIVTG